MMKLAEAIATACGLGHIPFAPGTFGSLPGLGLGLATHYVLVNVYSLDTQTFVCVSLLFGIVICLVGYVSILKIEKEWTHDDSRIVIDEVAGQYFATVFFPVTWFYAIASFALFRFFDILKPWPIRWVDREWHHAFATLVDDLMASLFAFAALFAISLI